MPEIQHSFGRRDPDARGYYGAYGGRFVPETLVAPVEELERAYFAARDDAAFRAARYSRSSASMGATSVSGTNRPPKAP